MKRAFVVFIAFLLLAFHAAAQIPRTLSYQGVLTDAEGKPRADDTYAFTFCLYSTNSGGAPIWCEQKDLRVTNGLFSTTLGDQTPFGPAVKFDRPYWLSIQVGNEPELLPRIPLTSVGYSMSSLRADTAMVSVASLADTTWRHSGPNIYRLNGNVGIGTSGLYNRLVVGTTNGDVDRMPALTEALVVGTNVSNPNTSVGLVFDTQDRNGGGIIVENVRGGGNEDHRMRFFVTRDGIPNAQERMTIMETGSVGIGTNGPHNRLVVGTSNGDMDRMSAADEAIVVGTSSSAAGTRTGIIFDTNGRNAGGIIMEKVSGGSNEDHRMRFFVTREGDPASHEYLTITEAGIVQVPVLEIRGGSDLAEPFEMSHANPLPAGVLVVIDKDNPGKLKLATEAYDKRVAGVISGAGGVNPGLTLSQEGVLAGGQHVALTGKVYALATAANGAIEPGDLLTTSNVPGHAMKASNQARWPGAVIGKAMSSLNEGEGLVLVLVNLQ